MVFILGSDKAWPLNSLRRICPDQQTYGTLCRPQCTMHIIIIMISILKPTNIPHNCLNARQKVKNVGLNSKPSKPCQILMDVWRPQIGPTMSSKHICTIGQMLAAFYTKRMLSIFSSVSEAIQHQIVVEEELCKIIQNHSKLWQSLNEGGEIFRMPAHVHHRRHRGVLSSEIYKTDFIFFHVTCFAMLC